jgi:HD-like signal output (HDOD) protein
MEHLMATSIDPALESARQRIASLPVLPVLDPRLPQVLAQTDVDLQYRQLRELLRVDPALAARVLKVANSAFYGSRSIASIDRALTVLGAVAVAGIAMVARFDATSVPPGGTGAALLRLRRHSLLTAVAARRLAARSGDPVWDPESAFVLGLLHDLSWLVPPKIAGEPPAQRASVPATEAAAPDEHSVLSAALFAHWQLPVQFIDAVRDHHGPQPGAAVGSALLAVAEQCSVHAGDEFGPHLPPPDPARSLALFALSDADLAELGAECAAEAAAIDGSVH